MAVADVDAKCPDEVDIDTIIEEVMEKNGVTQEEIPDEPFDLENFIKEIGKKDKSKWSKRYFRGRAYGQFKCYNELCNNSWSSAYAWCILDLKDQNVIMKFKQECSSVRSHKDMKHLTLQDSKVSEEDPKVEPCYEDEESVQRMVEWAVHLYLNLVGRETREPTNKPVNYRSTPEHREDLCEMCKSLGRRCFERKQAV